MCRFLNHDWCSGGAGNSISLQVVGWVRGFRSAAKGSFHAINASFPGLELVRYPGPGSVRGPS